MSPVPATRSVATLFLYTFALLLLFAPTQHAQEPALPAYGTQAPDSQLPIADARDYPAPAHLAVVDGSATVERDGVAVAAALNAPFVAGDRLRTAAGRVEVLFPDGTALDVDQYSAVDLQGPALIRLGAGRVLLVVAGANDPAAATRYQIDTPAASARTDGPGEYRIAVRADANAPPETELAVLRGSASLETERGAMPIGAGERTVARDGEAPSYAQVFNSARYDAFDLWAADERDARTGAASTQYLPQDLQMYGGTFDRYGSWEYAQPYGYVWYPSVAPDWRPYYQGYWAPYRPWGWTWIGVDFWAWPTHHYGRWGFLRNRWFWVPGRSWGPAWVSWAGAPGYVSWCPLGFDGRPVFAFSQGFANHRAGWTIVPRHSFGAFARVDRFAVAPHSIPATTAFAVQRTAPVAVPRPGRQVTGVTRGIAVPRVEAPQSTINSRQSTVNGRQSTVDSRQSGVIGRQPPVVGQPLPDNVRSPGYAVPRSSTASPRQPTTDSRLPMPGPPRALPRVDSTPRVYSSPAAPPRVYAAPAAPPRVYSAPPAAPPAYSAPPPRTYAPPQAVPRSYSAPPAAPPAYSAPPPRSDSAPQAVPRSYSAPPPAPRSAPPPAAAPRSGGSSRSGGESHGSARRQ